MLGSVPGQDLSFSSFGFVDHKDWISMHSSLAQVSLSQGRPAFIVLSFVCIFVLRCTCELWCSTCDVQGKREVTHQTVAVSRPYPWTQERFFYERALNHGCKQCEMDKTFFEYQM